MNMTLKTANAVNSRKIKFATVLFAAIYIFLVSLKPISLVAFYLLAILGLFFITKIDFMHKRNFVLFSLVSIAYVVTAVLSIVFKDTPYSAYDHLGRMAYFAVVPLVASTVYLLDISFRRFLYLNAAGIFLAFSVALIDRIVTGTSRAAGMYNPNTYADMLCVMAVVVTVGVFYFFGQKKENITMFLALIASAIGIVLSGSRGALISFFIVLFLAYWVFSFFGENKQKKLLAILFFVIFLLASFALAFSSDTKSRLLRIVDSVEQWYNGTRVVGSIPYRLEMYTGGLKAFVKHPILGYGYHAGPQVVAEICNPEAAKAIRGFSQLHNEYITALVNSGIIGYIALMALYLVPISLFYKAKDRSRDEKYMGMAGILVVLSYMVLGITHGELGYEYESVFYVTTLTYLLGKLQKIQDGKRDTPSEESVHNANNRGSVEQR